MSHNNRRVYVTDALNYVGRMSVDINAVAALLDLNPELVAGALAEEADTYFTEPLENHLLNIAADELTILRGHDELLINFNKITSAGSIDDKLPYDSAVGWGEERTPT